MAIGKLMAGVPWPKRRTALLAGCLCILGLAGAGPNMPRNFADFRAVARAPSTLAAATRQPTIRLLNQGQYINSLSRIFGNDIGLKIRFAPVKRTDGLLAVGSSTAVLTTGGLDPLDATGRALAEKVVDPAHREMLVPCRPTNIATPDPACAHAFFDRIGRLLYRRPLSDPELDRLSATAGQAVGVGKGDFYAGLAFTLSGMLVSPEFLFIREQAEPDPASPGTMRLDAWSKASRLSFLIWNAAPDDALLDAAARGELHNPAGLRRQVDRMMGSPLFEEGVRAFFSDFLVLEAFDNLSKDSEIYPTFSLKAVSEAREQILRTVVDHLITQKGDYRDLFTTRRTMMSSELAMLYRVTVNVGADAWVPYHFPTKDPRGGLLTQIGFLAQYSPAGRSSATKRGRAIREVLLCQHVPDPPPNVDFSKFEGVKDVKPTARDRLSIHNENPVCAGCHRLTDPIGLALENFDGAGQFRTTENGRPIDSSGVLDDTRFTDAVGLGKALHDSPDLTSCVMNRLYAYAVGQQLTVADEPMVARYVAALNRQGYRFPDMLRAVILDPNFFAVQPGNAAKGGQHAHQD